TPMRLLAPSAAGNGRAWPRGDRPRHRAPRTLLPVADTRIKIPTRWLGAEIRGPDPSRSDRPPGRESRTPGRPGPWDAEHLTPHSPLLLSDDVRQPLGFASVGTIPARPAPLGARARSQGRRPLAAGTGNHRPGTVEPVQSP